nr:MAG TPA: hypothetical protein [Caudoviricetes sp.]
MYNGVGENHEQKCLWFFSYVDSRLSALLSNPPFAYFPSTHVTSYADSFQCTQDEYKGGI